MTENRAECEHDGVKHWSGQHAELLCNDCCRVLPVWFGGEGRLRVGDVLEGFCEGYFGRDSYGDKTVVYVQEVKPGYVHVAVTESVWTDEVGSLLVLHAYSGDPENLVRNRK